jgi:cyclic pyranopterin phosphate synthase
MVRMTQGVRPVGAKHASRALVDGLGRSLQDLRISVMDRCNFRCPYCMPRDTFGDDYRFLKSSERLSPEEILRVARVFVGLGVRKLRLTGGEPLLRANLAELVSGLAAIDGVEDVALTTNGILLAQHAVELKANGLGRVTVSLDTLDPVIFRHMNGGFDGLTEVLAGIGAAAGAGLAPVKVNTVVQRGINDSSVLQLLEYFRGTGIIVRLIEYMDVGNRNRWSLDRVVPSRELVARIAERWPIRPIQRSYRGEVAERYVYDDGAGEIGFISSVTQPFCGGCTRARISSDGVLFTCLFASQGTSLRGLLREGATDQDLAECVRGVWLRREDRYSERRSGSRVPLQNRKVEMNHVGG